MAELGTVGNDVYEPDGDSAPDAGWKYGFAARGGAARIPVPRFFSDASMSYRDASDDDRDADASAGSFRNGSRPPKSSSASRVSSRFRWSVKLCVNGVAVDRDGAELLLPGSDDAREAGRSRRNWMR